MFQINPITCIESLIDHHTRGAAVALLAEIGDSSTLPRALVEEARHAFHVHATPADYERFV